MPPGSHTGCSTDSSGPPATSTSSPSMRAMRRVPSHGMFGWSHSIQRQAGAVGSPARVRHEVGAGDDHLGLAAAATGSRTISLTTVPSASWRSRTQAIGGAVGADVAVGVAQAPGHGRLGRDRHRLRSRLEPVEPLVGPVGEPGDAVAEPRRARRRTRGRRCARSTARAGGRRRCRRPAGARGRCGRPPAGRSSSHQRSSPSARRPPRRTAASTTRAAVIGVGQEP